MTVAREPAFVNEVIQAGPHLWEGSEGLTYRG